MKKKSNSFIVDALLLIRGLIIIFFWVNATQGFAETFSVLPKEVLPTMVPLYGKTSVYITVRNTTNFNLYNNFLRKLPENVTQVTRNPKYCGQKFNLGASGFETDSCVLKLIINGPVNATSTDLLVCAINGINCDTTSPLLNITQGPSVPFIGIAAGYYSDYFSGIFPLLVKTDDSGKNWDYPTKIFENLKNKIDPNFSTGVLSATACTGAQNKNICIAPGQWCSGSFCENSLPLIAVGSHNTVNWAYPKSVFQDLKTVIDPNFTSGSLRAGYCFGSGSNAVCIASGTYFNTSSYFPLLALSSNGGLNWTYPPSIFQNLTTTIDPSFSGGYLATASCTKSTFDNVCVASCNFTTLDELQRPLLAVSKDKGHSWSYPHAIFKNLKSTVDPSFQNGFFISSSCTGERNQAVCVAAGSYSNLTSTMPLLTISRDAGQTWFYPPDITKDLANKIGHSFKGGFFNAVSCSGKGTKAVCIAAGSYFRQSGASVPFLALTKDGGNSWSYPDFIYTKLKTLVDPNFLAGTFDGASCIGSGNKTICIAAGNYCNKTNECFPLLAQSSNGGKTWSYPSSVYSNLTSVIDLNYTRGIFSEVSCSGVENNNFCIAAGQYSNNQSQTFPLLAFSKDSGLTWSYPPYLFQDLTTTIPGFAIGAFHKASTSALSRNYLQYSVLTDL